MFSSRALSSEASLTTIQNVFQKVDPPRSQLPWLLLGPQTSRDDHTPSPYLTFIVCTDHSVMTAWQQYRPIGAVLLRPDGPECRCNVRDSPTRVR